MVAGGWCLDRAAALPPLRGVAVKVLMFSTNVILINILIFGGDYVHLEVHSGIVCCVINIT